MKEADILKALDRSEALLKDADGTMFMVSADTATVAGLDAIREDLGDAQHFVNNARQILLSLRLLMEMEKTATEYDDNYEPPEPDLMAPGAGEWLDRSVRDRGMK